MAIPSLAMIPSGYKATKLYSVLPTNGVGDFTVARASAATRVNSSGLIETVGADVSRLDYSDGGCPVLLTEPQSTNLVTYSESLDSLGLFGVSLGDSSNLSPSLSSNVKKITPSNINEFHGMIFSGVDSVSGEEHTVSIFAKNNGYNFLQMRSGGGFTNKYANIDLTTGEINGGDIGVNNVSVIPFLNGWFKVTVTLTLSTTALYWIFGVVDNINSVRDESFLGDGISAIDMWGAQVEKQPYATSYIKTEGTAITRVEDVVGNAGDANTFNSSEGVLRVNFKTLAFLGDFRQLSINSSGTNRIYLQIRDNGRLEFRTTNTLGDYFSSTIVDTSLDYVDCVFVWGLDRFAVYINGVDKGVSNVGVVFPANELIELNLHRGGDSDVFISKIKELMVYKSIAEAKEDLPYITI